MAAKLLLPPGYEGTNYTSEIHVASDGRFVYVGNRLPEGDHFVAQRAEEVLIAVRLAVGLHERLRVTQRSPHPVGQVPAMEA